MGSFYMKREQVNANSTDLDALNGTQIARIPPEGGVVSMAMVQYSGSPGNIICNMFIGQRQVIESAVVNFKPTADLVAPKIPDDLILNDELAAGGELIVMNIQNTTSGNLNVHYRINVEEP